jgi:hypothetical protein
MCEAIAGGAKLPLPTQKADLPQPNGAADSASGGGGIAAATTPGGPATAGAALLGAGPGSLGAVLTSLVDALTSLVAALGSAPVAGGGGASTAQPMDAFTSFSASIDREIAKLPAGDPRRSELEALRPRIDQLRTTSMQMGYTNQGDAMLLSLDIRMASMPNAGRDHLAPLRQELLQLNAASSASGSTDQMAMMDWQVRAEISAIGSTDPARVAQLTALHQKVAQERSATLVRGSIDPIAMQALADELARLLPAS